jgi:polar amino acid transport system substrate-binding protein/glutamate/aspartate transport system substrate-binding protein
MSFVGADGNPAGYSVGVCNSVVELLGQSLGREIEAVPVIVSAADRFDAVAEGRVDILCGAATVTLERRETVDFSIPIFVDGAAVMLRAGSDPEFSALAGRRIGVHTDTTTETVLGNSIAASGMEAEIVPFDSHSDAVAALLGEEIDAYFADQSILFALYFAAEDSSALVVSDNTLTVEKQALALPRGDDDFRLEVDRAISAIYATGRMREIFEANLPGATPGQALQALYLIAPELP